MLATGTSHEFATRKYGSCTLSYLELSAGSGDCYDCYLLLLSWKKKKKNRTKSSLSIRRFWGRPDTQAKPKEIISCLIFCVLVVSTW